MANIKYQIVIEGSLDGDTSPNTVQGVLETAVTNVQQDANTAIVVDIDRIFIYILLADTVTAAQIRNFLSNKLNGYFTPVSGANINVSFIDTITT